MLSKNLVDFCRSENLDYQLTYRLINKGLIPAYRRPGGRGWMVKCDDRNQILQTINEYIGKITIEDDRE